MKDKLIITRQTEDSKLTLETAGDTTWPELLATFIDFLRGCGYIIKLDWEEHLVDYIDAKKSAAKKLKSKYAREKSEEET